MKLVHVRNFLFYPFSRAHDGVSVETLISFRLYSLATFSPIFQKAENNFSNS